MAYQYNAGIQIMDQRRKDRTVEALTAKKGADFVAATRDCLDALDRTPTGSALLAAIAGSGHTVRIYRTWVLDDFAYGNLQGGEKVDDSMIVPLDTVLPGGGTELRRVLEYACADVSKRSTLKKKLGIGQSVPRFLKRDALARLAGTTPAALDAMEKGKAPIPKPVDERLRVYLYDFLTPGPGSDCYVVFNHVRDNLSRDHRRFLPESHNWQHRPPAIALGHELIHAWRVATGMVLFTYGQEEELMTVGLPPFSGMMFTENRLRVNWAGLAIRPDYQNLKTNTDLVGGLAKRGVDAKQAWQGNQAALVAHDGTAGVVRDAMRDRRAAMGYDDDGF
jgi:hypothetical protein